MEGLKTLKDLSNICPINGTAGLCGINIEELRQEAVKWVKYSVNYWENFQAVNEFIKHFFNLIEEDLK